MSVTKRLIDAPAVIALAANVGDRKATLLAAVRQLADSERVEVTAISTVIETPAGRLDGADPSSPPGLNAVVLLTTTLSPLELLDLVTSIEAAHGRVSPERRGARTLDLDIVDVAGITSSSERLTLPHPRAFERSFVLTPWLEVDPDAELPGHGRVADLVAGLPETTGPEGES